MQDIDETALTTTIVTAVAEDATRERGRYDANYPYTPQHARAVRLTPSLGDVVYTSVRAARRRLAELLTADGQLYVEIALRRETPYYDRRNVYTDRWRVLTDVGREAQAARQAEREAREAESRAAREQAQALRDRVDALQAAGVEGVRAEMYTWDRRISIRGDLVLDVLAWLEGRVHEQPEPEDEQPDQAEPEQPARRNILGDMVARQRTPVSTGA